MKGLPDLLNPGLASALNEIRFRGSWFTSDDLDAELDRWGAGGAEIVELGQSREGRPIRAAVIGSGSKTLLAWGHPHPDEPIGAYGLVELGRSALQGKLSGLDDWRLVLILCADPDNAARQRWFGGPGIAEFAAGAWRPTHLGLEVDYGFPIDWGPFYHPPDYRGRCRTKEECRSSCGQVAECRNAARPFGPLPESKALLEALHRYRPQIVASMHNTHTAGDYTFLLHREPAEVLDDLVAIPAAAGSMRHLGEPIDRGPRWRRPDPDLIRERTAEYHKRRLERHPNYREGYAYAGNASAAVIIGTTLPGAQFTCPESAVFRHPDFAETATTEIELDYRVAVEERRDRAYLVTRILHEGQWVIARQERWGSGQGDPGPRSFRGPATRAALGVKAVLRRRRVLAEADRVWDEVRRLPDLNRHIYMDERERMTVPGAYVADRSLLIFRTRPDYGREASVAQAATLNWAWPAHTVSLLANFRNFLAAQDRGQPQIRAAEEQLARLQEGEIAELPEELRSFTAPEAAIRSQLARVLRLMLAR